MITAAFKLLKLGPVVGQRTWGGVVGMTGRHRLGDGTVITVPMNAAWFDAYGWSVENQGVTPDLEVLRTPLDWAEGRHAQLDDAVRAGAGAAGDEPPGDAPGLRTRTGPLKTKIAAPLVTGSWEYLGRRSFLRRGGTRLPGARDCINMRLRRASATSPTGPYPTTHL